MENEFGIDLDAVELLAMRLHQLIVDKKHKVWEGSDPTYLERFLARAAEEKGIKITFAAPNKSL